MPEHDLESVAFPRLDPTQISALAGCAAALLVRYEAGRRLYQVGDRDYRFFVVQSGESRSSTRAAMSRRPSSSTRRPSSPTRRDS
jgi:hypothetical protein